MKHNIDFSTTAMEANDSIKISKEEYEKLKAKKGPYVIPIKKYYNKILRYKDGKRNS